MQSDSITSKLANLRKLMKNLAVDYYYVPATDPHHSEYVPAHWQRRAWISDFTGSAGDVLIGQEHAYLWTDSRYFLQAEMQLDAQHYTLMRQQQGTPSIDKWLLKQAAEIKLAVDPQVISMQQATRLQQSLVVQHGKLLSIENNLIDALWQNQPPLPQQPVRIYPSQYAGQTTTEKLAILRQQLQQAQASAIVVSALDEIAWLFNIRGNDIEYNPLVISYAVITEQQAIFFVDTNKIAQQDYHYFEQNSIDLQPYNAFADYLQQLHGTVWIDPNNGSWWMQQQLTQAKLLATTSPIQLMKAVKNATEQQGMREAHRRDAIAMIKFLCWLENNWKTGISELSAAEQLEHYRREDPSCEDLSFPTISAFAEHGAIIHYQASTATDSKIDDTALYLVDSGGQYHQGTTDVTRTIHLGQPTAQQKHHYTLILKGHIALRHCHFPDGTCGEHINAIARTPLWQENLDFGHGTGHGVGCNLCVHEGPQAIASRRTGIALKPGMMLSNEPGLYFANQYGIRIENICVVQEAVNPQSMITADTTFYTFDDLTLVPYCRKLINSHELSEQERIWINNYHQHIQQTLSNALCTPAVKQWLEQATQPI